VLGTFFEEYKKYCITRVLETNFVFFFIGVHQPGALI